MPRHEKTHRQVRRTVLPEERILRISFTYFGRERTRATKSPPAARISQGLDSELEPAGSRLFQ